MLKTVWSEKHRPSYLSDIAGQDAVIVELQSVVEGQVSPQHYIFYSPQAGTGKTTVARAFAKELGWPIHEFNASTKKMRGIEFIEEEIIPLCNVGAKTIYLLDEADQLTTAAQSALKGVIENADGIFILTCNDISKLSPWIQSRCSIKRFQPIPIDWMVATLKKIATDEGLPADDKHSLCINRIAKAHEGDLRSAINALQAMSCLHVDDRDRFTLAMGDSQLDYELFLRMCFRDKDIESAVRLLNPYDTRKVIREVFSFAISSNATPESKMKVVEAAIICERDCINGVQDEIIKWAFCTMLCRGFIGRWDLGQITTDR